MNLFESKPPKGVPAGLLENAVEVVAFSELQCVEDAIDSAEFVTGKPRYMAYNVDGNAAVTTVVIPNSPYYIAKFRSVLERANIEVHIL